MSPDFTSSAAWADPENSLPLARPEDVGEYFGIIAEKGFPLAQQMPRKPRKASRR